MVFRIVVAGNMYGVHSTNVHRFMKPEGVVIYPKTQFCPEMFSLKRVYIAQMMRGMH